MTSKSGEPGRTTLQVTVTSQGPTVIISATGEVDMVTAPRLEEAAQRAVEVTPPVLVLDLSEVTFLSSAGLAVLVRTEKISPEETEVRIVAASPATLRPLQLMGLNQDLAIYPTRDDAVTDSQPG